MGDHTPVTMVSDTVALTDPIVAEIVVAPSDTPFARPVVGPTVATDCAADDHVATLVTFAVVASEYVPVAVNCRGNPIPANAGLGAIDIDSKTAGVTVSVVLPDTDPDAAVTIVDPTVSEAASPEVAFSVATVGVPEVQLALLVRSAVLVSLNVPVALNCCVRPFGTLGASGVTAIDSRARGGGVPPPPPPHDARSTDIDASAVRRANRPVIDRKRTPGRISNGSRRTAPPGGLNLNQRIQPGRWTRWGKEAPVVFIAGTYLRGRGRCRV